MNKLINIKVEDLQFLLFKFDYNNFQNLFKPNYSHLKSH